jgi:hypothetical protein
MLSDVFLWWLSAYMLVVASIDRPDRWDFYRRTIYGMFALSVVNGLIS